LINPRQNPAFRDGFYFELSEIAASGFDDSSVRSRIGNKEQNVSVLTSAPEYVVKHAD
jgi:hypothetical protein